VWLAAEQASQASEIALVQGYLERNVPVAAIDIDSGWSTGYNNFIFDLKKYPDPKGMVNTFHNLGVRVILWVTSMIDTDSSNYAEAVAKGYIVKGVLTLAFFTHPRPGLFENTIKWWHGVGSFIGALLVSLSRTHNWLDYTNPQALAWWHSQMDNVLNLGIDGW
jgi:alpha-glucosidase (family GH31 glycosyl hydrolase)